MIALAKVTTADAPAKSTQLSVLQVFPQLTAEGVERAAAETAMAVAYAGGRSFVASAGGSMVRELSRAGVHHTDIALGQNPKFFARTQARQLINLVRHERIRIIHAHTNSAAQAASIAAEETGAYLVTTFPAAIHRSKGLYGRHNRFVLLGERIVAGSRFMAGRLQEAYQIPNERIAVVPRGIDVRWFDPARVGGERMAGLQRAWHLPDDASVVLMPARFSPHKGHRLLIDAMAKIHKKNIVAVMVGEPGSADAYMDELIRHIAARGLEGRVKLAGKCTDMPAAHLLADVVVSIGERPLSVARVIMEAQAMGRPVIASTEGAASEAMLANETGWLTPPGDPAALAATIELAVSLDNATRLAVAAAARQHICEEFSLIRSSEQMLEVYQSLLARRG